MPKTEPIPEIVRVEQAIIEQFRFDKREQYPFWPGCVRSYFRSFDKPNRKGSLWPRLVVYRTTLTLVAFEWRLDITYYDVTGTYNWHEMGQVPADDREELVKLAESLGIVSAYREDAKKRQEWPHRGARRIEGFKSGSKPQAISVDQLETPIKKTRKQPAMTRNQLKYAWSDDATAQHEEGEP